MQRSSVASSTLLTSSVTLSTVSTASVASTTASSTVATPTPTQVVADPTCANGKLSSDKKYCCFNQCSMCGGNGCGTQAFPYGSRNCCGSSIAAAGLTCDSHVAPCLMSVPSRSTTASSAGVTIGSNLRSGDNTTQPLQNGKETNHSATVVYVLTIAFGVLVVLGAAFHIVRRIKPIDTEKDEPTVVLLASN
jgi:hypothetical protein